MSPYQTYHSDLTLTQISVSNQQSYSITLSYEGEWRDTYTSNRSYTHKKEETLKEKKARQKFAFKMFFAKPIFVPINKNVFTEPSHIESCNRTDKFKSKALNLIQKNIN